MRDPLEVLNTYWGYPSFRSLQGDIIDSVLSGSDTVALLATGAGKSICYQVPALCMEGKTIVVSPLIALMTDQVQALEKRGIRALQLHTGMRYREIDIAIDNFVYGDFKLLYVSPERINTPIFLERMAKANITLIAVDESHCISQWGYDFRPSYFEIPLLRELHPKTPVIAVTATATDQVVKDIRERLKLSSKTNLFKSSFERKNLSLTIMRTEDKQRELLKVLSRIKGSGIIYVRSRSKVKELAEWLDARGFSAAYYHGGLPMKRRQRVQEAWIAGKVPIIISTNAFGMGVDKDNVRFVIHYDIPPSMEEYYQEVGRAGRDGERSYGVSIVSHTDTIRLQKNIEHSYPSVDFVRKLYGQLCRFLQIATGSGEEESFDFSMESFAAKILENKAKIYAGLKVLEKQGWIFLNEAIHEPSKLVFTTNRRDISLSTRSRTLKSQLILFLLRNYEGLYIDYIKIDEEHIAKHLDVSVHEVVKQLKVLHRESVVSYLPKTENPKIVFLVNRPPDSYFFLETDGYEMLKNRAVVRMNTMIDYIHGIECRTQQLLKYFDEVCDPCGRCDICQGSHSDDYTKEDLDRVEQFLKNQGTFMLGELVDRTPYNKRKRIKAIIAFLESERIIDIDVQEKITYNA